MTKPAAFSGEEDVDEVLFTFETYFESTGCDRMLWPKMVMTLLSGKARSAYMATATTHTSDALTWDMVRKCLLDAFAAPDKRIKARTELHQVKQNQLSAKDYVRHVRALVTKCGPEPPCAVDLLMFFFNGLNRSLQEKTAIDPHTGRFWTDFDALANHLITVEMHSKDLTAGFRPYRKPKSVPLRVAALSASQGKGVNAKGKTYATAKAAAQAAADKEKQKGQGSKRKHGEQMVPMAQLQAVMQAVMAEKGGKKKKKKQAAEGE